MLNCPLYRLRLFLSVDLVGSTAYKARSGDIERSTQQPKWVKKLKAFYQDFPNTLGKHYERVQSGQKRSLPLGCDLPKVWKTVGDEILFCCRVKSVQHAAVCVKAFIDALEEYGNHLEGDTIGSLDVKGAGWLGAFPSPNVTVGLPGMTLDQSEGEEAFEAAADEQPNRFDFLGQNIDAGFRTCRNAAGDQFSTSVELAYVLSLYAEQASLFIFYYRGREVFKGVISGRPYPVVTIYTERKQNRRHVKDREDDILNCPPVKPSPLSTFLSAFMEDEGVEKPCLPQYNIHEVVVLSESYKSYKSVWETDNEENQQRDSLLQKAEQGADGPDHILPDEIERNALEIIAHSPAPVKDET